MEKITSIELLEKLKSYKGFGIGLHGIDEERSHLGSVEAISKAIMDNGLKLGSGYRSINGNVKSLGIVGKDDESVLLGLENYAWGGKQSNIIVAYPGVIENQYGEKLYLGFTESPAGYDQDTSCSMMDKACSELGYIPKEFILGYYSDSEGRFGFYEEGEEIQYDFEENPDFCRSSLVSDELFRKMGEALRYSKPLSVACATAIETADLTEVANIMKSDLVYHKIFNNTEAIDFLKTIFKDVGERIVDNKKSKGIEEKIENETVRRSLFDEER